MQNTLTIKRMQWLAFILLAFTDVRIILSTVCQQVPSLASKFPFLVSRLGMSVMLLLGTIFALIANIILSRISSNRATSKMMLYSGIFFFVVGIIRVAYSVISNYTQSVEIMRMFLFNLSILYFLIVVVRMYMFGVISRSNPQCTILDKVLWIWTAIMIMDWFVDYKILGIELFDKCFSIYNIVSCLLFIVVQYIFISKTVFDGIMDNSPAPAKTYSAISKYMVVWLVCWLVYILILMSKVFL